MSYPPGSKWVTIEKFTGFNTKIDPCKLPNGDNPSPGQNTSINDGDRVSVRQLGYTLFPKTATYNTDNDAVKKTSHTFRLRSGENIMMWPQGTQLMWYNQVGQKHEVLNNGYTSLDFGYADYNINTDQHSYVYFGNGVQDFSRWNGAHTTFSANAAIGDTVINVVSTSGFNAATSTVIIGGNVYSYSALTATTFTLTIGLTTNQVIGDGVAQHPETFPANPKGNVYLAANNRLFIAGIIATPQAVYFSEYGNATNFVGANLVTDTTATSPGIFNLAEGGGGVTHMRMDEQSIYGFKKSIIYKFTLSDSLYTLEALKPFDGKSQTIGAEYKNAIFTGGNGVFFITPDNQIMNLTRVERYDYPQVVPISDVIKPTVDSYIFTNASGIVFRDKAFFAARSNNKTQVNDVVLVWDMKNNFWETPVFGWNVADWTIYDDGTGDHLYFLDAVSKNIFKVNTTPVDNIFGVKSVWASKQFDFGHPEEEKTISKLYVEGYINENTILNIKLLLDEDGTSGTYSTNFKGTETKFTFFKSFLNLFGVNPFGIQVFGSNTDTAGIKKFRVYLDKNIQDIPFYNAQLIFSSEGQNQNWSVVRFGFLIRKENNPIRRTLERIFS